MKINIISGLSGSGKSIALNAFEDEGYYCIDNLPVQLLLTTVKELAQSASSVFAKVALGIDVRSGQKELKNLDQILSQVETVSQDVSLIYLQASEDVLIKRYGETRRKHPLTHSGLPLTDAISKEKELLEPVAVLADLSIDTSRLNLHELSLLLKNRTGITTQSTQLSLLIQSFGFKHGLPLDSDFVFDLRCLPNPHWIKDLRPHTGREAPVIEYLEQHAEVEKMFQSIRGFFDDWLKGFQACNRSYVTVSLGCTGGRHRSVFMAEKLFHHLKPVLGDSVQLKHREIQ